MRWRTVAALGVLIGLVVSLCLYPPIPISDEYHDQFCLTRGCIRKVHIYRALGTSTELEETIVPNCLASYSTAMLGPCPGHRWISYHGGYSRYMRGLAYYFSMRENASFSGSNRELVTLAMDSKFNFVRHVFQNMYKRDPDLLRRVLSYILQRLQKDRWKRYDEFMELMDPPKEDWNALRNKLNELEQEP